MSDKLMKDPILEATKIQAKAVIPVVKALEQELGKERAHGIIGRAIAGNYLAWRDKRGFVADSHPASEDDNSPGFPVEKEVVEHTELHTATTLRAAQLPTIFEVSVSRRSER